MLAEVALTVASISMLVGWHILAYKTGRHQANAEVYREAANALRSANETLDRVASNYRTEIRMLWEHIQELREDLNALQPWDPEEGEYEEPYCYVDPLEPFDPEAVGDIIREGEDT